VAQEHPHAFIVLTSRPGADARELPALRLVDQFVEMELRPLSPDAIAAMVEHVLGAVPDRQALVHQITELAVGHPLFAREYALLRSTSGASAQTSPVPMTIQSLIASRLDALSPAEDLTLKAACVIGDTFSVDIINGARPDPHGDLHEILARLSQLQLLVHTRDEAGEYGFQHALIREVAYEQLTREQRTGLHRRVAEVLEGAHVEDLPQHYGTLAHHWHGQKSRIQPCAIRTWRPHRR
jgi:predicted ATPase